MVCDAEDFQFIVTDYENRLHTTYEVFRNSYGKYIQVNRASLDERRREALNSILDCIKYWREMVDNANVVLGSGDMVQHLPIETLVHSVNWESPKSANITALNFELTSLMQQVNVQINAWVDENAQENQALIDELIEKGIRQEDGEGIQHDI